MSELSTPAAPTNDLAALAMALVGRHTNDRWSRRASNALGAYVFGKQAVATGKKWHKKLLGHDEYRIAVAIDDPMYPDVNAWLMSLMPGEQRSVLVRSGRDFVDDETVLSGPQAVSGTTRRPKQERLHVIYDGVNAQTVLVDGHKINVRIDRPTKEQQVAAGTRWAKEQLVFTAESRAGADALIAALQHIVDARQADSGKRGADFLMVDRWGNWDHRNELPRRELDSVILDGNQKARLVDDLDRFLNSRARYARLGIPWHRGYLLHGPPGTGKTSLAQALATHFDLNVFYVPLADITRDANLLNLVAAVRPGSMLLLEDIDALKAAHDRDDDNDVDRVGKVSISGLLNALDGVATPHGMVTVMTSNHVDKLDPALIRAGRIDMVEEISHLSADQFRRLMDVFLAEHAPVAYSLPAAWPRITPADVVEIIKQHIDQPEHAGKAVLDAVHDMARAAA